MKVYVIDDLISEILACVRRHRLAPGAYARWSLGEDRDRGINPYGCADAANILYMIGDFPRDPEERADWIRVLQGMQDPETGLFHEKTHHPIHTTAHCTAALELFDAAPLHPMTALEEFSGEDGIRKMLEEEVDWTHPWPQSHKGAGILVCLGLTGRVGIDWIDRYFDWMWEHSDPEIGFFHLGGERKDKNAHFMAGGFHYIFNHEAERRPMRYPEKVIDSCIKLMSDAEGNRMLRGCNFLEIDVVYGLTRAMRQSPHRFYEGKAALEDFAEKYVNLLLSMDYENNESFNDLHCLFGAVCCLAELQVALPGKILTTKPLRLVLDRRPFI